MGFRVFLARMILLELVGLDSQNVIMSFARWQKQMAPAVGTWHYLALSN